MNWTVPPGAAPALLAPVTVAVNVTLPPEVTDVTLEVTAVVVFVPVMVTVAAVDVEAA